MKRAIFAWIIGLLVVGGTLPRDPFRLERTLPDSTLVFLHTPNGANLRAALQKTSLVKLFEDPEMRDFAGQALGIVDREFGKFKEQFSRELGMTFEEAVDLIDGQVAVALVGIGEQRGDPPMKVVLTIDAPGKRERLLKVLDFALRSFGGPRGAPQSYRVGETEVFPLPLSEAMSMHLAVHGDLLVAATSRDVVETVLNGDRQNSLASSSLFQQARKRTQAEGGESGFFFLNLPPTLAKAREAARENDKVFDALGLDAFLSISGSITITETDVRERFFVGLKKERKGLARLLSLKAGAPDLSFAPEGVVSFTALRIDLPELYDTVFEVLEGIDPGTALETKANLERIEREAGISLREDLLPAFGDEMYGYWAMPELGLVPDSVTIYEIADEAKFEKCLQAALKNLHASIGEIPFEDKKIQYLQFEYGEMEMWRVFLTGIYWYRDGKHLAVTGSAALLSGLGGSGTPNSLKRLILAKKKGSIASTEPVKSWLAEGGSPAAISYIDFGKGFTLLYNSLAPFLPLANGFLRKSEVPLSLQKLPLGETFAKAIGKSLTRIHVEEEGLRIEGSSTCGITMTTIMSSGILAALMLPAMMKAQRSAQEVHCMNNLMQLWRMQHIYAVRFGGAQKRMPEATGSDFWMALSETNPPLIDDTVMEIFLCPISGGMPGTCSYNGPARDVVELEDTDAVGMCDDPSHVGGAVILFKNGTVLNIPREDPRYEAALGTTKK